MNPVWNESLMLHCALSDVLKIHVWDEDTLSSDDSMGKAEVVLSNLALEDGNPKQVGVPLKHGHLSLEITYTGLSH